MRKLSCCFDRKGTKILANHNRQSVFIVHLCVVGSTAKVQI